MPRLAGAALALLLLLACSRESTPTPWAPQHTGGTSSASYNGGLQKVWILTDPPTQSETQIRWKTGKAHIAKRSWTPQADTVYLAWETLPEPFKTVDSVRTQNDTLIAWTYDTTYFYRDTVFAVLNGEESEPMPIEIKNILPKIDSLVVGGVVQGGDSTLVLAAHLGSQMEVAVYLSDAFNTEFPADVKLPDSLPGFTLLLRSDSVWKWSWTVPNDTLASTITDSLELQVTDNGGHGERTYQLRLSLYTEYGSAWVASQKSLVKFAPDGAEVARIEGEFGYLEDIAIDPNAYRLWAIDRNKHALYLFHSSGKLLYTDSAAAKNPLALAVDVVSRGVWIAQVTDPTAAVSRTTLARFANTGDSLVASAVTYDLPGLVHSLTVDPFSRGLVWFACTESDTVGFVSAGREAPKLFGSPSLPLNRPSAIALDPSTGLAWIADSSRILAIDTSGVTAAIISGFHFVSSVSAGGGVVWAADVDAGLVYQFPSTVKGTALIASSAGTAIPGFYAPLAVSALASNGSAWVLDKGKGQAVRLSKERVRMAEGTGLDLPQMIQAQQVVE
jgi:hypothetical protein